MTASNDTPDLPAPAAAGTVPCAACGATVTASARFCQACGAPMGVVVEPELEDDAPLVTGGRSKAALLPWMLALTAVVGGSAYVASREGDVPTMAEEQSMVAPFVQGASGAAGGGATGGPPNIAAMSPSERANRLYGRIMQYVQQGKADSAAIFAPMALAAHEMLEGATIDERYHHGQLGEMIGNGALARAQADTILKAEPDNLLGLILGSRVARMENRPADARPYDQRLLAVVQKELATKRAEYEMHRAEIDRAVAEARR